MKLLRHARQRWSALPTWGKLFTALLLLNEARGVLVAYYAVDHGALAGGLGIGEMAMLLALIIVPAAAEKVWRRKQPRTCEVEAR